MTAILETLQRIPFPYAFGAVSLLGSLGVLGFTLRWSVRSLRHLSSERERRERRVAAELARVEGLEREASRSWAGYRKFQVVKRTPEDDTNTVATYELMPFQIVRDAEGGLEQKQETIELPTFKAGQYLQIRVDLPGQANLLSRCYSLSRAYTKDRYQITVARVPGSIDPLTGQSYPPGVVSNYLLDNVHDRAVLDITVPQGDFWLDPNAGSEPIVLVGWGIHAVPLLCIYETVARQSTSRQVWMFLELGTDNDLQGLLKPLKELTEADTRGRLRLWVSHGGWGEESGMGRISRRLPMVDLGLSGDEEKEEQYRTRQGRQAVAWVKRQLPDYYQASAHFYVSGPALLLREAKHDLDTWGVSPDRVHFEVFDRESLDAISEVEESGASSVTFAVSGKSAEWDPDHRNLLGLAASVKVRIPSTCKIGKCGECEVSLVSGQVRYAKDPDWKLQPGHCLPCVATPASSTIVIGA